LESCGGRIPPRQFGGTPEGIVQDAKGNSWVLLTPGSIAELDGTGNKPGGLFCRSSR